MPRRTKRHASRVPDKTPTPRGRKTAGRPTLLTEKTADALVGHLYRGNHITTACALSGVPQSTFHAWVARGKDARAHLDATGELRESEKPYLELAERVDEARATAEADAVAIIVKATKGGNLLHEKPLQDLQGALVLHPETGEPMYDRAYSQPDGRLALRFLTHARPNEWSSAALAQRIEVSGAGGGPVRHEVSVEQITSLSERIAAVKAQQERDRETWDGQQEIEPGAPGLPAAGE